MILIQNIPILDTIIVSQSGAEEQILAYIRVRQIDALVELPTAFAPIGYVSGLSGAVGELIGAADVTWVKVPLIWAVSAKRMEIR